MSSPTNYPPPNIFSSCSESDGSVVILLTCLLVRAESEETANCFLALALALMLTPLITSEISLQNPACNLCGHNFHNTQDFLGHVRMHFSAGGAKRKPDQSPPYPGPARAQPEPVVDRARKRKAETESLAMPPGEGKLSCLINEILQ